MAHVVGISGNISRPSRTRSIIERVLASVADRGGHSTECFDIVDAGPGLGSATSRKGAPRECQRIWSAIEGCDALVVGSPVYKASYSGMFKHLFDLLDKDALRDRPVVLCATGRLPEYGFVIEHQLRPLFGFFGCATVSGGVYASDPDFEAGGTISERLAADTQRCVDQLFRLL